MKKLSTLSLLLLVLVVGLSGGCVADVLRNAFYFLGPLFL